MSGFRPVAFTARTSRLCACAKVIARCRALDELPALTIADLACGAARRSALGQICAATISSLGAYRQRVASLPHGNNRAIGPVRDLAAPLDGPFDLAAQFGANSILFLFMTQTVAIDVASARGFRCMQRYLTTARSPLSLRIEAPITAAVSKH